MDADVLALAGRQFGVLAVRQLVERFGWTRSRIYRGRRSGVLIGVTACVVRLASSPETMRSRCMALQLHAGECGFVSGWTAARLHGCRGMPSSPIHFTLPEGHTIAAPPPWADLRTSAWYDPDRDRDRHADGLLVATPLRTLFGLAAAFNQYRFERAAEDAWHLGLVTPESAATYLERHRCRGKDGVSTLERWLERALPQARPAQSGLELDVIDALAAVGVPPCVRQHPLRLSTGELIHLDLAWPDIRLAVEPGATWWHGGDDRQQRDQARDLAAGELGWQVLRISESFRDDPMAAARRIERAYVERLRLFHGSPRPTSR